MTGPAFGLTRLTLLLVLWAAAATAGCAQATWHAAADDAHARAAAPGALPEARLRAGELALLVDHDVEVAERHLTRALADAAPGSALAARAGIALAHLAVMRGSYETLKGAIVRGAAVSDPLAAEALVGSAGLLWGSLPDSGARPADLVAALEAVAARPGAAWEPARAEALGQLVTAAQLGPDAAAVEAARSRAGVVRRWRVSAPWGTTPDADAQRALGPEARPLAPVETVGDGFGKDLRATWELTVADGEILFHDIPEAGGVGFAEAWIALPEGAADRRVVVRLESNRTTALYANRTRVLALDRAAGPIGRQARVGLTLPAGATRLLVKLATGDGRGFARVQLTTLSGGVVNVAATPGPIAAAVASFAPPRAAAEAFLARFPVGDGAAAMRALFAFEALLHRPLSDVHAAWGLLRRLRDQLGEYPGLSLAEARLLAVDRALSRTEAAGRRRAALELVLDAWPDNVPALRSLGRLAHKQERQDDALKAWTDALSHDERSSAALIDLLGYYVERGWEAEALATAQRLRAFAAQGPRVLQELVDSYRRLRLLDRASGAADELLERFPLSAGTRLAAIAGDRGRHEARAAHLLALWERHPSRLSLAHDACESLRAAGRLDGAREIVARVLKMKPGDAWSLTERARIALQVGDTPALEAALDAALAAHPDVLQLEVLAALLAGRPAPLVAIPDGRAIVARWRAAQGEAAAAAAAGFPYVTLLDNSVHHVRGDGTVLQLTHVVRVVQAKTGADRLGELQPPRDARLLVARTIKPDGRVLWPDRVEGKGDLSLSGLQPGDAVEWAWITRDRVRPEEGGYLGGLAFASWDVPTVDKRADVWVDKRFRLDVRARSGAPEPVLGKAASSGATLATWRARDLPPIPKERFAVGARSFFPFVDLTVWPREAPAGDEAAWGAIARAYRGRLGRLTVPGHRVRALAAELRRRAPGEPLNALWAGFDWVKQEINASEAFNAFASTAETAVATQRGNRTVALAALGRALDVPAAIWLCAPRRFGAPGDAARPLPNANRFWYPVLRLGPASSPTWADPARPYNPFGVLPRALHGARCLDLAAGDGASPFATLPGKPSVRTAVGWGVDLALTVDAKGTARGILEGRAFGPEASGLRHVYLNAAEAQQRQLWQQWAASVLPGARVTDVAVDDSRDADKPLRWRLTLEIPGYLRPDGDRLAATRLLPPLVTNVLAAVPGLEEIVALPARRTPLRLVDHSERVTLSLTLPEGMVPTAPPSEVAVDTPELVARQRVRIDAGRTLRLERELTLPPARVEPAEYASFRARVNQVIQELSHGVVGAPR